MAARRCYWSIRRAETMSDVGATYAYDRLASFTMAAGAGNGFVNQGVSSDPPQFVGRGPT